MLPRNCDATNLHLCPKVLISGGKAPLKIQREASCRLKHVSLLLQAAWQLTPSVRN